jgi:hypothetical protein
MDEPFVERRVRHVAVAHDRRRPTPAPRPKRGRTFLYELAAALSIITVLTVLALWSYSGYIRRSHDAAAESDMHNAIYSILSCSALSGDFPPSSLVVGYETPAVICAGQSLVVSPGTTLLYRPAAGDLSFVLLAHNAGGRPAYWCWDLSVGGAIRTVADAESTC